MEPRDPRDPRERARFNLQLFWFVVILIPLLGVWACVSLGVNAVR